MSFFLNSMAAGASIALSGYAYLSVDSRYLGACLFSFGLYAVCQYGLPLFTGRIAYLGRPGGYGPDKLLMMLAANFVGAAIVGLLYLPVNGGSDVLPIVQEKMSQTPWQSFVRGLFCGAIVFIGVDIFRRYNWGRYLGVLLGVPPCAGPFEHCGRRSFTLPPPGSRARLSSARLHAVMVISNTARPADKPE